MVDRFEMDSAGVIDAAEACRTASDNARTELAERLRDLTRSAVEAAAGTDDYGKQIVGGWSNGAESFPEFAEAIASQLFTFGNTMSVCRMNAENTDRNAAYQVGAADLGLEHTAEGWGPKPDPSEEA